MESPERISPSVRLSVLNKEQMDQIYQAALTVLGKTGFKTTHAGALAFCAKAGCAIDGDRIRVPKEVVETCIGAAPKGFTIYNRLGEPVLDLTGRNSYYGCSTGSPQTMDAFTGEIRDTTYRDLEIGALVSDALPNIDWVMPFGTSQDTPRNASFLFDFEACVINTTKPIMFLSDGPQESLFIQEMAAACVGGKDPLREKPFLLAYPEPITPLCNPADVLDRAIHAADWGIPQCPGTSQLMGATSPVTLAGATVLWLAEALMSIVVLQLYKPGSPTFLSGNFHVLDMSTTNNTQGAPEMSLCLAAQAQFGQRLGLPTWGLAGSTDSMALDAQAGGESAFSVLSQGLAGLSLIHDVGYMGAGMICSAAMLVMGDEFCGMTRRFLRGINVDSDTLATEVIDQVGSGGNFLQHAHTFRHFRDETWFPTIINRDFYQNWLKKGSKDMRMRIQEKLEKIISTHKPEPLSDTALADMEKIRREGEKSLKGH